MVRSRALAPKANRQRIRCLGSCRSSHARLRPSWLGADCSRRAVEIQFAFRFGHRANTAAENAHPWRTRAHHRSASRTHQTQSRRNRPRKSNLRYLANHEAAGSPVHRRSRWNLLEAVTRRNLRRAATRPALSNRHRQTGLTQDSRPRAVVIRNLHHHSPLGARHAVPERPNSTRVPYHQNTLTSRSCDPRTQYVDYRTRPIRSIRHNVFVSKLESRRGNCSFGVRLVLSGAEGRLAAVFLSFGSPERFWIRRKPHVAVTPFDIFGRMSAEPLEFKNL
jgi:hypothetical protein